MMRVFDNLGMLSDAAAEHIASHAQRCVDTRGRFSWLLAGGSTPATTYRLLAANPYGEQGFWWKTHFYWGDERCVPPESEQSNYYLARQALLDRIATPDAQIHRMPADKLDLNAAAREYGSILPEKPDLILLGMGADGHTASLFPGSPALKEKTRRVVPVEAPEYAEPRCRMTVTPPVLASAEKVLVLVAGKDKADALERVFLPDGDVSQTPARLVRDAVWFVDRAAADRALRLNIGDIHRVLTQ